MRGLSYVGIDPSFSKTGIAVLTHDKRLVFHTLSEQIGKKDFINTFRAAKVLADKLHILLEEYQPYEVVMEYPPPIASMSPVMFALNAVYAYVLGDALTEMYHPMTMNRIIGIKKKSKLDSVNFGKLLLASLQADGYTLIGHRLPCHDCLEALIYICFFLGKTENEKAANIANQ